MAVLAPEKRKQRVTSGTARATDLEEFVLQFEVLDELPDPWPHRAPCTNLGERMGGLVDVDLDVLGVLLQEEREKEASKA